MKAAVYTRTGDKGTTGLYTGERVPKQSMRAVSYTHLDVYKRQRCSKRLWKSLNCGKIITIDRNYFGGESYE